MSCTSQIWRNSLNEWILFYASNERLCLKLISNCENKELVLCKRIKYPPTRPGGKQLISEEIILTKDVKEESVWSPLILQRGGGGGQDDGGRGSQHYGELGTHRSEWKGGGPLPACLRDGGRQLQQNQLAWRPLRRPAVPRPARRHRGQPVHLTDGPHRAALHQLPLRALRKARLWLLGCDEGGGNPGQDGGGEVAHVEPDLLLWGGGVPHQRPADQLHLWGVGSLRALPAGAGARHGGDARHLGERECPHQDAA